jgi:hypothetical protein
MIRTDIESRSIQIGSTERVVFGINHWSEDSEGVNRRFILEVPVKELNQLSNKIFSSLQQLNAAKVNALPKKPGYSYYFVFTRGRVEQTWSLVDLCDLSLVDPTLNQAVESLSGRSPVDYRFSSLNCSTPTSP